MTIPRLDHAPLSGQPTLQTIRAAGWSSGFANLWRKEGQHWWGTWRWLWQIVIWILIVDGTIISAQSANNVPASEKMLGIIDIVLVAYALFPPIGAVVMAQGKMLDEWQSGTAGWILSKPVTRSAFLLSKFADLPSMLLVMVLLPGLIAYPEIRFLIGYTPSLVTFGLMLGLGACFIIFLYCFLLLLGTRLKRRAVILGLGLLACFSMFGAIINSSTISTIARGQVLFSLLIMAALLTGGLFCMLLALWLFTHEEF